MATERLEVRPDPEHRRKLSELAAARGAPVSEVIRQIITRHTRMRSVFAAFAPSGGVLSDPGSLAPNVDILRWKTHQPLNRLLVFVLSILATSQETE